MTKQLKFALQVFHFLFIYFFGIITIVALIHIANSLDDYIKTQIEVIPKECSTTLTDVDSLKIRAYVECINSRRNSFSVCNNVFTDKRVD